MAFPLLLPLLVGGAFVAATSSKRRPTRDYTDPAEERSNFLHVSVDEETLSEEDAFYQSPADDMFHGIVVEYSGWEDPEDIRYYVERMSLDAIESPFMDFLLLNMGQLGDPGMYVYVDGERGYIASEGSDWELSYDLALEHALAGDLPLEE